jgi:hypothetical protein
MRDEVSGGLKSISDAVSKSATTVVSAEEKIAQASKSTSAAKAGSLSQSRQIEYAVRAEAAAGKPLEIQLVKLEKTYEELTLRMRAMAKAGEAIPTEMTKQAGAAKASIEHLKQMKQGAQEAENGVTKLGAKMGPAAATLGLVAMASMEAKKALSVLMDSFAKSAPPVESLTGAISATNAALIALKDSAEDADKLGIVARTMYVAWSAFDTKLLESRRDYAALQGQIAERERASAAAVALATDGLRAEAEQAKKNGDLGLKNAQMMARIERELEAERKKRAEADNKRREERLKKAEELAKREAEAEQKHLDKVQKAAEMVTALADRHAEERLQVATKAANEEADARVKAQERWKKAAEVAVEQQVADMREVVRYSERAAGGIVNTFSSMYDDMTQGGMTWQEAAAKQTKLIARMAVEEAARFAIAEGIKQAAIILTGETQVASATLGTTAVVTGAAAGTTATVVAADTKIAADTATMVAGATAAYSGIPFVGIGLAAAAIASFIAIIAAFKKFATGGEVTGGTPGRDSVPALLTPGEYVLSVPAVQQMRKMLSMPDTGGPRYAQGGPVSGRSRGSGSHTTIVLRNEVVIPAEKATIKRQLMASRKALREMIARGQLVLEG